MFKFRLQRVLELREKDEQDKARSLAAAEEGAERARASRDQLMRMQEESRAELMAAQTGMPRVGHLQQLNIVLISLEQRLIQANEAVAGAEQIVADARGALEIAARDRQVLDRLKEKHEQVWRTGELHADRQQMDEIALTRFARGRESTDATRNVSHANTSPASESAPVEGNP